MTERRRAASETDRHMADIGATIAAVRAGGDWPAARIDALAHRYLASSREGRGRIDPAAFAAIIRSELAGRFLHQGRKLDETQASRMLAACLRRARVDIENRTHFIPCRLWDAGGPASLAVGPVIFRRAGALREVLADAMGADPEFGALFERDFAPWPWGAEVCVRGCDRVVSRRRALAAVDGALDMLRLFAEPDDGRILGRAGAPGLPTVRPAGLWSDEGGRLHPVRAAAEPVREGSTILQRAHGQEGGAWLGRAGRALAPIADPSLQWPLAARFREAASWFGEAVNESSAAGRVVQFVAAIERAVVVGDHAEVWRTVTRRAAVLAAGAGGGDVAALLCEAKSLYECRSLIVHGAMSPFAPEVGAMAPTAARLARDVLHGALDFYDRIGLARARCSTDRLEREFRRLEAHGVPDAALGDAG